MLVVIIGKKSPLRLSCRHCEEKDTYSEKKNTGHLDFKPTTEVNQAQEFLWLKYLHTGREHTNHHSSRNIKLTRQNFHANEK